MTINDESVNLAVLRGRLAAEPTIRALPSGTVVAQFDVATRLADGDRVATASVPVAWHDPADRDLAAVTVGEDLLVVGAVRRRFFRAGGSTQSRTEVVAAQVVPARRVARARTVLDRAVAPLTG